jgi:hypothetical protein
MGLLSVDDLMVSIADELNGLSKALRIGIDMECTRTSPSFTSGELHGGMYMAQHEP